LSRDPAGYVDGLNLYAYVRNNPVNRVDPTGLVPDHATPHEKAGMNSPEISGGFGGGYGGPSNFFPRRLPSPPVAPRAPASTAPANSPRATPQAPAPARPASGQAGTGSAGGSQQGTTGASGSPPVRTGTEGAGPNSKGPGGGSGGPQGPSTGEPRRVHSRYSDGTPVYEGDQPGRLPRTAEPRPAEPGSPGDPAKGVEHSKVQYDTVNNRVYKTREYDSAGNPVRDVDRTNPTYPDGSARPGHPGPPHQHRWVPNDAAVGPKSGLRRLGPEETTVSPEDAPH
jgi:hypothetical protein